MSEIRRIRRVCALPFRSLIIHLRVLEIETTCRDIKDIEKVLVGKDFLKVFLPDATLIIPARAICSVQGFRRLRPNPVTLRSLRNELRRIVGRKVVIVTRCSGDFSGRLDAVGANFISVGKVHILIREVCEICLAPRRLFRRPRFRC